MRGQERHEAGRVVSDLGEASTPFTALHCNALPLSISALPKAEPEECVMVDFYSFARSSSSQSRARSQLENMTDVDLCATRGLEQVTVQGMEGFRDKGCKDCNYDDITLAIPNPAVKTIKRGGNRFGSDHSRSSFTPFKPPHRPSRNVLCETRTLICPVVSAEVHLPNSAAFIFWHRPLRRRLTTLVGLRQYYSKCLGGRRGEQANYGSTLCKGDSRIPL